jgi:hypothetical protein
VPLAALVVAAVELFQEVRQAVLAQLIKVLQVVMDLYLLMAGLLVAVVVVQVLLVQMVLVIMALLVVQV